MEIICFFRVRKDHAGTGRGKNVVFSHKWIRKFGYVLFVSFGKN